MAKKESEAGLLSAAQTAELAKVEQPAAGTAMVAYDPELAGGFDVVGDEKSATELMQRVAVYYGTADEDQKYGQIGLVRGDLVVVSEKRKAASNVFVPIIGQVNYVKWPKDSKVPEYVYPRLDMCPPEDREFAADGTPPVAQKVVSMVVLVDGEGGVFVLNFKATSLKAYDQLRVFENARATSRRTVGAYETGVVSDKNHKNNVYYRMTLKAKGDIPASLVETFKLLRSAESKAKLTARVNKEVSAHDDGEVDLGSVGVANAPAPAPTDQPRNYAPVRDAQSKANPDDIPF
jgi:hypothetical protein